MAFDGDPQRLVARVRDLESAGVDLVWGMEMRGYDIVSTLGYLAGQTHTIRLMTGVLPVFTRSPSLIADTARTLAALSGGRFLLGLGLSGPGVVEGWHGVPYRDPLARAEETIRRCRDAAARPGNGFHTPIGLAVVEPGHVEIAAAAADVWQTNHFIPERFDRVWGDALSAGSSRRDGDLGQLQIFVVGPMVAIGKDRHVAPARAGARRLIVSHIARSRGAPALGPLAKYGWPDRAADIAHLCRLSRFELAAAAVPDEYVDLVALAGDEGFVRDRVQAFRAAGVAYLSVAPYGPDPLATIEKVKAWASA